VRLDRLYGKILLKPEAVNYVQIRETPSGCIIAWSVGPTNPAFGYSFPMGHQEDLALVNFNTDNDALNEFGLFYISLFILGNYARYYPEEWMADVEKSSELAFVTTEFLALAERRIPVLVLSELSQNWHVSG
jgi:hypothetical protein